MKRFLSFLMLPVVFFFIAATSDSSINLGDKLPSGSLKMPDIEGAEHSLNDLKGKNGILVVFSCNTCPFVLGWEDRYNEIYDHAKANGISMVLINSNEAKRGNSDSPEKMKKHAQQLAYKPKYLVDKNSKLADAFGAKTTPHVFLFDGKEKLVFRGAIDDNYKDKSAVKKSYVKDAISQLGSGKAITVPDTKPTGCSIKRVK